jgi:hypothetical protein
LRKRVNMLTVVLAVLLAPSLIFAASAHKFVAGKAVSGTEANTVVVPLVVTNEANLTAMDIPLKFSEGVTLTEVNFENVRTSYFDLKIANINNEKNQVIIGLLPQLSAQAKPDLEAGTGPVANLVFRIDDPTVSAVHLETFTTRNPGHFLTYVYHKYDESGKISQYMVQPDFTPIDVSLSGAGTSPNLPKTYALNQNYPNPFNPTTEISFDLPKSSHVELNVFNVLGQNVKTLVDQNMAAGSHTLTWDASGVASGVYFYRIKAEDFTATKKMMVLK